MTADPWDLAEGKTHSYGDGCDPPHMDDVPEDDEEETDEERAEVAEAREDVRAGRTRPWADVVADMDKAADVEPDVLLGLEWNAARVLSRDEEAEALRRFRPLP